MRVGSLRLREKLTNLELMAEERDSSPIVRESSLEHLKRQAATTELHLHSRESDSKFKTNNELNLIGKTTDEAVDLADKFLDEAFLNGVSEVRIIHGHGTGALRKAITEFLSDHPHVEKSSKAPQEQGGSGATIVELRS